MTTNSWLIVIAGPIYAGKEQYIKSLVDAEIVASPKRPIKSLADAETVAFRLEVFIGGRVTVTDSSAVYFFKQGGAKQFRYDPEIHGSKLLGVVLLANCARPETCRAVARALEYLQKENMPVPYVTIANHYPQPDQECYLDELRTLVRSNAQTELLVCDAADRQSAYGALRALLSLAHQTPAALAAPAEYQVLVRLVEARANGQ